jgi:signal transduction histidine kinase/DNA-binding response OmpR family regulator
LLGIALIAASCSQVSNLERNSDLMVADSLMEEAYKQYDNANFNKSIELCRQSMDSYRLQSDSASLSDAYSHLSACYQRISMNDSALSNCYSSLRIDEKLKDKERLSSSYNNLAAIYLGIDRALEAKPFIKKAIVLEQAATPQHPSKLSVRYGIAAEIYLKLNKTDSALAFINKAYAIDSVAADTLHMARRMVVMGDIYSSMEREDSAFNSYNNAIEFLNTTADKYSLAVAYKSLGSLYEKRNEHGKALECLEKSTELAKECNARRILLQNYYLMGISPANKNHDKVVEYLKNSNALKDSIYNDASSNLASHYNMTLEAQNKQITIEEQQHSITMQRLIIAATSIALLLVLLGFASLFRINILRARAQRAEKNAEQMKDMFFTNMTHEFRTPLTVILGEAQALREGVGSHANHVRYDAIINQGNHMLNLVNQLLSISKVRSSIGALDWHHGDFSIMTKMILENMRINAESKGVNLNLECTNQDYNIDFVPDYCHSIVSNLMSNAVKFTPSGGSVTVKLSRHGSKVGLSIADTGVGISANDLPHIFDLFYQGDTGSASLGTGIGLALVKQMTEAMNGKIEVESQQGNGTTFHLTLPAKHAGSTYPKWVPRVLSSQLPDNSSTLPAPGDGSLISVDQSPINSNIDRPIVLIVEDNPDVALFLGHILEEKYQVVKAQNGTEGVDKAREIIPDIIVTDIMMPHTSGIELCKMVRADELLNHIPIIIVTARSGASDRLEALAAGADAFLVKPFNNDELKALVEALLTSRQLLRHKYQLALHAPATEQETQATTTRAVSNSVITARNTAFITKVRDIITTAIDNPDMGSTFIASKMNLSQRQLNRKIKSVTGVDTSSLIREIRIARAKELLCSTDIPVTEVGERCGFDSASYFSKIFKQHTKLTPSDYRKAFTA